MDRYSHQVERDAMTFGITNDFYVYIDTSEAIAVIHMKKSF